MSRIEVFEQILAGDPANTAVLFGLAKEYVDMPVDQIEKLMESPIHEVRAGAMSIMGQCAKGKKCSEERLKELYELYLRRHDDRARARAIERFSQSPRSLSTRGRSCDGARSSGDGRRVSNDFGEWTVSVVLLSALRRGIFIVRYAQIGRLRSGRSDRLI